MGHRTRERGGWAEMSVATGALLVLLLGFRTVVEGADWFVSTALVALLVATTTITLRMVGLGRTVTPIALVAEIIVLSWVFVPSTLLVIVPTSDTIGGFRELIERAGPIIAQEQAPVAPSSSIVLVLAASFGALVIAVDLLLRLNRGVSLIGVLLLAVFIVPGMITGTSPSVLLFVAAAVLWLALLRGRTAVHGSIGAPRQAPAVVLGTGGLVAALLFPVVSPDVGAVASAWGNPPPQVFGRGINPIVELGTNLRRNTPVTVLDYTTSLNDAPYLKVATLPDFTGQTWKPSADFDQGRFEGALAIADGIKSVRKETRISIRRLRSDLLPVPYPTVSIRGLDSGYRVERNGLTVESTGGDVIGQTYTVQSIEVLPTANQLRATNPRVPPDFSQYVALEAAPAVIADTAREVTRGARNNYDRALALQRYFRSSEFRYSETAPVAEDYDGNGLSVIAEFLQRKAGYCVHFSSSMAVMARTLDIPSRVAVGYAPGSPDGFDNGRRRYTVQSDDLHAWTELYFDGVGWVKFEPTPGVGQTTSFDEPAAPSAGDSSAEGLPDATGTDNAPNVRGDEGAIAAADAAEESSTAPRSAAAVLVVMLAMVLTPGLLRRARRSWRLRETVRSPEPAWREIEDTARDLGVRTSSTDTPRGFAGRLRERAGLDSSALDRVLGAVERSRYAESPVPSADAAPDARLVVASLAAGARRGARLRANLLPRSLGPRPGVSRTPRPSPAA
ncbi:MAG: DUF3488 and transglutaminase-like domain-containing protein [Aeromicrobium sp.]|uniref:transglutaminase TgpA family protein n=1 Tax=Aeromicrobium sp. TaxID=1871063 RepID=UPI003C4B575F